MNRKAFLRAAVSVVLLCIGTAQARTRELTFEDRVCAQEAIDRVYYYGRGPDAETPEGR